ncbi:MAG: hypothetical protein RMK18_07590 [Armatimonadota bacterium]|nr:hypothetical protein [Armatimonadota bacterium]MCX7776680.1 hypothetical protein [Armatimonadota bacterium]MDW8025705.1 hypothetical protein [Armatimonadota bacterium]
MFLRKLKLWLIVLTILISTIVISLLLNAYPRHIRYKLELRIRSNGQYGDGIWMVGASKAAITPSVCASFIDKDSDGRYEPLDGDKLSGTRIWLAGFHNSRPASRVHDQLWARAVAIDNGVHRIGIVALDLIGLFYDDVIDIRDEAERRGAGFDYIVVTCTHNHNSPDTLGLWGRYRFSCGVDASYMDMVKWLTAKVLIEAVSNMRRCRLSVAQAKTGIDGLIGDSRPPFVVDDRLIVIRFFDATTSKTVCTIIQWANHPEAFGSRNTMVTSDFVHWVRCAVEDGIRSPNRGFVDGLGGIAIYINGAIGGLMSPTGVSVRSLDGRFIRENGVEKARALGENIGMVVLELARKAELVNETQVEVCARTITLPIENWLLRIGAHIGVVKHGYFVFRGVVPTEIAFIRIGNIGMLCIPGELYPEVAIGGVESPDGADYAGEICESPPLLKFMPTKFSVIVGLANDELGYFIPKTQWDAHPPYTYGERHYGEIMSLGPNAACLLYRELVRLIESCTK